MFDRRLQIGMVAVKKNVGLFVRKLAASLFVCVVCSAGAKAADLPMQQTYKAAPVAVQVYNWTGLYVGVNGGYGWGTQDPLTLFSDRFDRSSFSNSGGMFGGTIGAQIQQGYIVLGVEGDLDWANIKGSTISTPTIGGLVLPGLPITLNIATNTSAVGTARLRAGVAMNNWLFYATGGVAFVKESANGTSISGVPCGTLGVFPSCSASAWRPGIAAGLGAEWGFAQNWSAKLEYLYIDAVGSGVSTNHIDSVRSGINYRF
jgi:outer membrane immunogenic protein